MGVAKAWLPFGDEVLLQRIVRVLSGVVSPVVVVAAPGQELPALADDVVVTHDARERRGPLEGMLAGFRALEGRVDAVFVASCDAPLLKPAFVRRVIDLLGDQAVAVPAADGYLHPLAAVYRLGVQSVIEAMLAADRLKPTDLVRECDTREITPAELFDIDPGLDSLRSCNTPEAYEQSLRAAGVRLP